MFPNHPPTCLPLPYCSLMPLELTWGGAALLNISLLSSDLWAALARIFFFGGCPARCVRTFMMCWCMPAGWCLIAGGAGRASRAAVRMSS